MCLTIVIQIHYKNSTDLTLNPKPFSTSITIIHLRTGDVTLYEVSPMLKQGFLSRVQRNRFSELNRHILTFSQ
jgi:hypothetical protein